METSNQKLDRIARLLEDMHDDRIKSRFEHNHMVWDLILTTVCGSVVGYFLFRILDLHFGSVPIRKKRKK